MLTKIPTIVRASELRKNLSQYIRESANNPVVISTERGGDTRVLLARDTYNTLVSAYEDAQDRKMLEARVTKDNGTRIPLATLRKQYGV